MRGTAAFSGGFPLIRHRPRKLRIAQPAASGRPRSLRCSSSPHTTRFAGLMRGPRDAATFPPGGRLGCLERRLKHGAETWCGIENGNWIVAAHKSGRVTLLGQKGNGTLGIEPASNCFQIRRLIEFCRRRTCLRRGYQGETGAFGPGRALRACCPMASFAYFPSLESRPSETVPLQVMCPRRDFPSSAPVCALGHLPPRGEGSGGCIAPASPWGGSCHAKSVTDEGEGRFYLTADPARRRRC